MLVLSMDSAHGALIGLHRIDTRVLLTQNANPLQKRVACGVLDSSAYTWLKRFYLSISAKHEDNQIRFPHSFVGTQGLMCACIYFPLRYFSTAISPDTSKLPFTQLKSRR